MDVCEIGFESSMIVGCFKVVKRSRDAYLSSEIREKQEAQSLVTPIIYKAGAGPVHCDETAETYHCHSTSVDGVSYVSCRFNLLRRLACVRYINGSVRGRISCMKRRS